MNARHTTVLGILGLALVACGGNSVVEDSASNESHLDAYPVLGESCSHERTQYDTSYVEGGDNKLYVCADGRWQDRDSLEYGERHPALNLRCSHEGEQWQVEGESPLVCEGGFWKFMP